MPHSTRPNDATSPRPFKRTASRSSIARSPSERARKRDATEGERLQKVLAKAGIASRRKAEEMILNGHIKVNGKPAELGMRVRTERDKITVHGEPLAPPEPKVYFLLNKPRGYITSRSDEFGRPTVLDLLPEVTERIYPIGRLDYDTEGLLILTNDGDLANALMHPSYQVPRTYYAKLSGDPKADTLKRLVQGVALDDGVAQAIYVERLGMTEGGHTWVEITLTEGRNREIRRMCEAIGHEVRRLRRVRFASLELDTLPPGEVRPLSAEEVRQLRSAVGASKHNYETR